MRPALLLLLSMSAPAIAADQYDLACQGTKVSKRDGPGEAYAFKVRIDIAAKKWCMDSCATVSDIYEVKPDLVVLAEDIVYNTRTDFSNSVSVDRKSHAFVQLQSQDRPEPLYMKVEAACTEQPFTPFPKAGS